MNVSVLGRVALSKGWWLLSASEAKTATKVQKSLFLGTTLTWRNMAIVRLAGA